MDNWTVVLLHTKQQTLLKSAVETAFSGRAVSFHIPTLAEAWQTDRKYLLDYFRRWVYDSGIWRDRVLTIYGTGWYHHFTYALTKLALERRGLDGFNWTYFHWDNHRDDWNWRNSNGILLDWLNCANFVDSIVYDHQGIPFFVGPDSYPRKDAEGYRIGGTEIPIYHNFFTKDLQESQSWPSLRPNPLQTGLELPSVRDLRETPVETYLTFDLDLLARSEIVTHFPQNDSMTLRRVCQMLDHVRPFKRVFGADILGYADEFHHPLSALTVVILARKVMGLGIQQLLEYHTNVKRRQAIRFNRWEGFWNMMDLPGRESPINEGELLEVLKWAR